MISAISLAFRGRRPTSRGPKPEQQVKVDRKNRVRVVKMPSEPKTPRDNNDQE